MSLVKNICKHNGTSQSPLKILVHRLTWYYNKYCTIMAKVVQELNILHYYTLISKSYKIETTWKIIKKETAKNKGVDNTIHIQLQIVKQS